MLYEKLKNLGFKFQSSIPDGAAYIMNDGMFLSIDANRDILELDCDDRACHPQLDVFVLEKGLLPKDALINRVLCDTDNAVRVNDGSNLRNEVLIGLPKNPISSAQYEALDNWLFHLMTHKSKVAVGNEWSTSIFKEYNFNEYMPEDIIKKIRIYYSTGTLRDSDEK